LTIKSASPQCWSSLADTLTEVDTGQR